MFRLTVISGKGGTGKTTVTANLAYLAQLAHRPVLADCDVDAPNLHLLLNPVIVKKRVFINGRLAVRDDIKCTSCGLCRRVCRFNAIDTDLTINPFRCEGCNVCGLLCPEGALVLREEETGHVYVSHSESGPVVHARLKAGADNSGKLVSEVRDEADRLAEEQEREVILIDGSPGIGCPVIASLQGVDLALVVTEPTRSGLADLKRVMEVVDHFGIEPLVVINKHDINETIADEIGLFCRQKGLQIGGRIPFDSVVNRALHQGKIMVNEYPDSRPALALQKIWQEVSRRI